MPLPGLDAEVVVVAAVPLDVVVAAAWDDVEAAAFELVAAIPVPWTKSEAGRVFPAWRDESYKQ